MKKIIPFVLVALLIVLGSSRSYSGGYFIVNPNKSDPDSEYQKLARDIFKELIEINTTSGYGSTKAAEAMATRLKSGGFSESDINVIGPDIQHKNLIVRFRGSGKLKPVLFICHLDVVEAIREDWSVDPFTFLEKAVWIPGSLWKRLLI